MKFPEFKTIYGVDFSGARLAGRTIWLARIDRREGAVEPSESTGGVSREGDRRGAAVLTELHRLEDLCGTAEREPALAFLVDVIARSHNAIWAIDFPFGLPIELMQPGDGWPDQLDQVKTWDRDGARGFGHRCLEMAKALGGANHIRRLTDTEVKTPFDTYHYRIIYQTFHGMRDVLAPLTRTKGTAILPFQYSRLKSARRAVIEACPSSTLKRLGLPYRNYKQTGTGAVDSGRRAMRSRILRAVANHIQISRSHRKTILDNPGGDALDAVIAALGALHAWSDTDHDAIARHPRYPREGFIYA